MELGEENLSEAIRRLRLTGGRGSSLAVIRGFWKQMINILGVLRSNSIVHMDLKPDNLILFGRTLKIADLGISRKANVLGYIKIFFFSVQLFCFFSPSFLRIVWQVWELFSLGKFETNS